MHFAAAKLTQRSDGTFRDGMERFCNSLSRRDAHPEVPMEHFGADWSRLEHSKVHFPGATLTRSYPCNPMQGNARFSNGFRMQHFVTKCNISFFHDPARRPDLLNTGALMPDFPAQPAARPLERLGIAGPARRVLRTIGSRHLFRSGGRRCGCDADAPWFPLGRRSLPARRCAT
jgi:hypothetical protein